MRPARADPGWAAMRKATRTWAKALTASEKASASAVTGLPCQVVGLASSTGPGVVPKTLRTQIRAAPVWSGSCQATAAPPSLPAITLGPLVGLGGRIDASG